MGKNAEFFNKEHMFLYVQFNSKINGTHKGVYLPIPKLHSILVVANLLCASKFITTKIECSLEMGQVSTFGVTIYLAVDCTIAIAK